MTDRRDKLSVALWLAALAVSAWFVLTQAKIHTDLTGFLPAAPGRMQQLLLDQLRDGPASRLVLIGIEGGTPARLAPVSAALADALRRDRQFSFVHNGEFDASGAERDMLMRYRYLLSPETGTERFSAEALKAALQTSAQLLASQGGALAKSVIPSDPTGEVARILGLWTPPAQANLREGVLFSADGSRALLLAQTRASGMDADRQQQAIATIRRHFAQAAGMDAANQEVRILLSGPGVFAAESRAAIEQDAWRLSVIATILVWLLLWTAYRSVGATLLAFLPAASGLLAGVAIVALVFDGVHGITLAFGATLIGEAVDYPSYAFLNTARGESVRHALTRIGPTLRLAILTTVFSSLAMLLSSFSGLAQLGLLTLTGTAVAGLVTYLVLPAFAGSVLNARKMERLPFALTLTPGRRWRLALAPLIMLALAVLYLQRAQLWDDDLASLSPLSAQAKQLDQELRSQLGAPDVRYLLMAAATGPEQALQRSEAIQPDLQRLVQDGVIGGFDMAAHYLPSQARQRLRQSALPADEELRKALQHALAGSPFRATAFQPFLTDVASTRQQRPMRAEDLQGSAIALKVQSLLLEDKQGAVALITLNKVRDAAGLQQAVSRLAPKGIVAVDLKDDTSRLINRYRGESLRLSALGMGLIALLLLISLRSVRAALAVLYPVIAGTTMCAALLVMLGEKLTLFHLVSLLLVIGTGLNYALFFNRDEQGENDTQHNHLALATCGLTTFISFGTLMLSGIPVLHAIGQTVALGSMLCLACAYLMAPAARREA